MQNIQTIMNMTKKICEEQGYISAFGKNNTDNYLIKNIGVSMEEDGKTSIFAELEKISEKQKEYIDRIKEKHSNEKKEKQIKENKYKTDNSYSIKRVNVEASSMDEFRDKINKINWDMIHNDKYVKGHLMNQQI